MIKGFFKVFWAGWKAFALKLGVFNTKVLLTITYFTMIAVASFFIRILGKDLLDRRYAKPGPLWKGRDDAQPTLETARRQF